MSTRSLELAPHGAAGFDSRAIVLTAEHVPVPGVKAAGPHQTYRGLHLSARSRALDAVAPDDIRVQMIYAGICGTDVHFVTPDPVTGYCQSSAPAQIPAEGRIIGHEGVGQILAVGEHVKHVAAGDVVAFESIVACHRCDVCRRGNYNQCRSARLLGMEIDGIFGTVVDVPASLARGIGILAAEDRHLQAAACLEPAAVAYLACENSHLRPADRVTVLGGGPIGLLAAMMARLLFGASFVRVVEPVAFRRELARKWSDEAVTPEEFLATSAMFDVLIDASGDLDLVASVFTRLDANGRVCLLARNGRALTIEAVDHMITNNISIIGSRGHLGGIYEKLVALNLAGRLPLNEIVTGVVDGVDTLLALLQNPASIVDENCKVLCRLGEVRQVTFSDA